MNDSDFPFAVTIEDDGSFTFKWDESHPVTSVFNGWTEQDFLDMLVSAAEETLKMAES